MENKLFVNSCRSTYHYDHQRGTNPSLLPTLLVKLADRYLPSPHLVARSTISYTSHLKFKFKPERSLICRQILGGIADTVAQTLTAVRQRAVRKGDKDDFLAIEIHELDRRHILSDRDLIPDSKLLPPPFDFERLTRFMSYGFLMAPIQHKWFGFLTRTFPITKTSAMVPALKRMALDQLMFAPVGTLKLKLYICGSC